MNNPEPSLTPTTWYEASAGAFADYPLLRGEQHADVCVIGGGLTGLAAALELRERGRSVVVLEQATVGAGASGRNGGQVGSGQRLDVDVLERRYGVERSRSLWAMAEEAKAIIAQRIVEHDIQCHWRAGNLTAITRAAYVAETADEVEHLREHYGYTQLQMLDMGQMHRRVASTAYLAGCLDHGGGHLHPLLYVRGLARAAATSGVRIFERSAASRVRWGAPNTVLTAHGSVRAEHVLFCGNGCLPDALEPRIAGRTATIDSHQIVTAPLGRERARALIVDDCCVYSTQRVLDYFRLTHDHRLIFGGGESHSRAGRRNPQAAVQRSMLKVFPQLHDVAIDWCWSGRVCITMNRMPEFGRVGSSGWYVQGFSGHGVALSQLAGRLLGEALCGSTERFDVFADIEHRRFPGVPWVRDAMLSAAIVWQRLRDRL